jgi:heme A synthase
LATLLWIVVRSGVVPTTAQPLTHVTGLLPLATLGWLAAVLAMVTAAMTAKSGASLACATWPSCNGTFLPSLDDPLVRIHVAHRALAAVTGLALLALFVVGRRAGPVLRPLTSLSLLLVLGEIGLGALVIVWAVPTHAAVLHQAVGVLTFAVVTLTLWIAMVRRQLVRAGRGGLGEGDGYALQGT